MVCKDIDIDTDTDTDTDCELRSAGTLVTRPIWRAPRWGLRREFLQ
jgi:hypothetical protein